jgi:NAD(P)H-quinone oxidoreductase subunit 5
MNFTELVLHSIIRQLKNPPPHTQYRKNSQMVDTHTESTFSYIRLALLWGIPLCYFLASVVPAASTAQWRLARVTAGLALLLSLASCLWMLFGKPITSAGFTLLSIGEVGIITTSLRSDALTLVVLLVAFIGWVIVGYSQTYLAGEPNQSRYIRALLATLSAVALVILTNNLMVLALAWLATSLSLHQLLTFYAQRQPAQIAAHKKFLASRLADICIFSAIALIAVSLGTLEIDQILARVAQLDSIPASLQAAAVLIAITALLKCAQIPLHGWLIQVMEAPTPVSALLHAGVVNLGGLVLIRMAGLISEVPAAQTLLVIVGALTACIAALVMMTRISIKVMLAWSTCAQMGFMLMQCGLGAYELALLHLIAHSLYKAYAFLSAGTAVEHARLQQMTAQAVPAGVMQMLISAVLAIGTVLIAALVWNMIWQTTGSSSQSLSMLAITMAVILSLAITPLIHASQLMSHAGLKLIGASLVIALIYFGLHSLFIALFNASTLMTSHTAHTAGLSTILIGFVLAMFVLLFLLQSAIRANPSGALARRLYPWFYGGLFLDEMFTRVTFRIWPVKLSTTNQQATKY